MATKKPKTATKSKKSQPSKATAPRVVAAKVEPVEIKNTNPLKGFFARKYDANENILTIFKSPKIIGALLGEVLGTLLITVLLLTLGVYQPLYIMFGVLAITVGVFAMSGAHLNPIVTVGQMATRRISAIRGVLYIIAQVLGAWFGLLIVNAFRLSAGDAAPELTAMSAMNGDIFWVLTMIEFFGATIIGFFFARALAYKRSVFTFAAVVAGGLSLAILFAIVISSNFLQLQNNFILNPAAALMFQILPSEGADFGSLLGDIALALCTYVVFPLIGGVVGFYIADFSAKLAGANEEK
jgi:glycerol uptake facilitator-like aquaporin